MINIEKIRNIDIFKELSDDDLLLITEISKEQEVPANTQIFADGEQAHHIYALTDGKINIIMGKDPNLEPVIIDTIKKGEVFGWSALVDEHAFTASSVAISNSRIIAIDGKKLKELCDTNDRIGSIIRKGILHIVSSRITHLRKKFKELIYSRRRTMD